MRKFLRKRWLGIPIGVIAVVVLAGTVALASILLTETQTITQDIIEPAPPPPDYGSITANPIAMGSLVIGESVYQPFPDAVTVVVRPDGVNKYLHLKLDAASANLYTDYRVTLTTALGSCPEGSDPIYLVVVLSGDGAVHEVSQQLTVAGTYTFAETIHATAGSTPGSADVKVTITLEDDPVPAP